MIISFSTQHFATAWRIEAKNYRDNRIKQVFFIFNTWDLLSEPKIASPNLSRKPCTRPPSCTTPRQPTLSDPDLVMSDSLSPPALMLFTFVLALQKSLTFPSSLHEITLQNQIIYSSQPKTKLKQFLFYFVLYV